MIAERITIESSIDERLAAAADRLGILREYGEFESLASASTSSLSVIRRGKWVLKAIRPFTHYTSREQLFAQVEESRRWPDVATQTLFDDIGVVAHPFVVGRHPTREETNAAHRRVMDQGRTYLRDVLKKDNWIVTRAGNIILIDFLIDLNNKHWRNRRWA